MLLDKREKKPGCPLCDLPPLATHWYFVGGQFKIIDCEVCHHPKALWNLHGIPSELDMARVIKELLTIFPGAHLDRDRHHEHEVEKGDIEHHWFIHVIEE